MSIEMVKVLPKEFDERGTPVSGRMIEPGLIVYLGSGEARAWAPFLEKLDGYHDVYKTVAPFWCPTFRDVRGSGKMVFFVRVADLKKLPWLEPAGMPFVKLNKADQKAADLREHNKILAEQRTNADREYERAKAQAIESLIGKPPGDYDSGVSVQPWGRRR